VIEEPALDEEGALIAGRMARPAGVAGRAPLMWVHQRFFSAGAAGGRGSLPSVFPSDLAVQVVDGMFAFPLPREPASLPYCDFFGSMPADRIPGNLVHPESAGIMDRMNVSMESHFCHLLFLWFVTLLSAVPRRVYEAGPC